MEDVLAVKVSLTTPEDAKTLKAFDYTKLTAVNTCPTWGILRYGLHRTAASPGGRSMALEAGSAAHEVFAAVRLFQLREHMGLVKHADHHGVRLFGETRYEKMVEHLSNDGLSSKSKCYAFCLEALYTSGFYDDPSDKKRTVSTLEEACIAYIDRWPFDSKPVWVRDVEDPTSDVGIEVPFDITLTFVVHDPRVKEGHRECKYRYIGKMDGLHRHGDKLVIQENKTASRINDSWQMSFEMSHQITGYCMAATLWTGEHCDTAVVQGLALPLPRSYDMGGVISLPVNRPPHLTAAWFKWFYHTVMLYEQYEADPANAPRYSHSCNRYFSSCMFIPYCTAQDDEKADMLESYNVQEWSPLHETKDATDG